jgi:hypothetical protein
VRARVRREAGFHFATRETGDAGFALPTWQDVAACFESSVNRSIPVSARVPLPRLISQVSQFSAGPASRPGVVIGRRYFIDHGVGAVIGDTADRSIDKSLSLLPAGPLRGMCKRFDL